MTGESDRRVLMATIGGAQGIKGEVRVRAHTQVPTDLGAYGPLFDTAGRRFTVAHARMHGDRLVVRFAEVADRNGAEALNGRDLFVDRAALPEPADDDEIYQDDLIDLTVVTVSGATVGRIVAVQDFGAGDILEITPETGGQTIMVPFSEAAVPTIDLEAGRVMVEPVAAGLDAFMPADERERLRAEGAEAEETRAGRTAPEPDA